MNLPKFLRRDKSTKPVLYKPLLTSEITDALLELAQPVVPKPKSRGRVIKQTRHSEFNPNPQIRGGRIVKVMPRNLQKIKAAQEMVEDDGPKVEDIED